MIADKVMPHPLHLLDRRCGSTYWYFRKNLTGVGIYDINTIMLCNLKTQFSFANSCRTCNYNKLFHRGNLSDNTALCCLYKFYNILYFLGHRKSRLYFSDTFFKDSLRVKYVVCLSYKFYCFQRETSTTKTYKV